MNGVLCVFDVRGVLAETGRGTKIFYDPLLITNIEAIHEIKRQRKDFFPTVLSGSTWPGMSQVIKRMEVHVAGICEGAVIVTNDGVSIESHPLHDWNLVKALLEDDRNKNALYDGVVDYWPIGERFHRFYFGLRNHDFMRYFENERELIDARYLCAWTEFLGLLERDVYAQRVTHLMLRTPERIFVPHGLYDIHGLGIKHLVRPKGIDKAFGMRRLVLHFSHLADDHEIWYFGDSENDQPVADMEDLDVHFVAVGDIIQNGRNMVDRISHPKDLGAYLKHLFLK